MSTLVVKTKTGSIIGTETQLPNKSKMYAFKGIPYADVPKRFQVSKILEKFSVDPIDCTKERSIALQKNMLGSEYVGSEDCLYLNIYTPSLREKTLPVMFWIHGGAFNGGSGNSDLYSPEYLVQEGVVVVTINYRLGPLGFLSLPSMGIFGNAGLKDQLIALKFISKNIEAFGGDNQNITLFGESAGGASVYFHLLSDESKKYFHKAICQSGVATNDWVLQVDPEVKAKKLAEVLGCTSQDDRDIYDTLMNSTALDITRFANQTVNEDEKRRSLVMPFRPVIEVPNETAFITEHPLKIIMKKDSLNGFPIITGVTDMEGIIMLKDCILKMKAYNEDFCKYIPKSMNLTPDSFAAIQAGKDIKNFYFGDKKFDESTYKEMCQLMTDFHFAVGHYMNAELLAKYQHSSSHYMYRFCHDGGLNMFKKFFSKIYVPGACHADDLFYLFLMKLVEVDVKDTSDTAKVRSTMCKMWTNFAKYGNPTPDSSTLGFKWEPVENISQGTTKLISLKCLDIDNQCKIITDPDKKRIDFWRSLYQFWNYSFLKPKL